MLQFTQENIFLKDIYEFTFGYTSFVQIRFVYKQLQMILYKNILSFFSIIKRIN